MAGARELTCDYLIVGAGATGVSFLEELVTSDPSLTAVIVDCRAAPGGHWNDAYSFVRLHQPAVTYGVNSRTLGAGGADLASKAQILQHYELAMQDLLATGRVTYLSQCRYIGSGKVASLVDASLEYQVTFTRKVVDATLTETKVPATSKPNFAVAEGVNFVPVNGLSSVAQPWDRYMVVGGGKTGIDAVLFLLDHGLDPAKICWVIPNDSWLFNRHAFAVEKGIMAEGFASFVDAVLGAETGLEALHRLEAAGHLFRLDQSIEPTRFRAATVSKAELVKLAAVRNIVRRGRIARLEADRVVFQSGEEMLTGPTTLHVDCSTNSTLFYTTETAKKVWDGDRINLQMIMLPPPGTSASVIAALELKFPMDEEKKNSTCSILVPPQMPFDIFSLFRTDGKTQKTMIPVLGFSFQFARRAFVFKHLRWTEFLKVMYIGKFQSNFSSLIYSIFLGMMKGDAFQNKLQQFIDENQKS